MDCRLAVWSWDESPQSALGSSEDPRSRKQTSDPIVLVPGHAL
jgi:hypothetical protein